MSTTSLLIRRQKARNASGELVDFFVVPAIALKTPQGLKLIPNPNGQEAATYPSLEEAEDAARQAGFDVVYEGVHQSQLQKTYGGFAMAGKQTTIEELLKQSIPVLIERLTEKDKPVLVSSIQALGNLKATQALEGFIRLLTHEDMDVRRALALSFSKLGTAILPRLHQEMQTALNSGEQLAFRTRLSLIQAYLEFARVYEPEDLRDMTDQVLVCLQDPQWLIRSTAAQVIDTLAQRFTEH